jgi:hypothetical protein
MTWQDEIGPVEPMNAAGSRRGRPADARPGRAQPTAPFARIVELRINPDRALPVMLGLVVLLCCISFSGQLLQHGLHVNFAGLNTWITYFDLEEQGNVPAAWRWATLLVIALALWTIGDDAKIRADGWSRQWHLLALGFALCCLDDVMAIHQHLFVAVQKSLHVSDLFFFAWVLPGIALVAVIGLMYGRFLWVLPRRTSLGLCAAAALYLSGAACLSMLRSSSGPDTVPYSSLTTVGAALQMFGLVTVMAVVARTGVTDLPPAGATIVGAEVHTYQRSAREVIDVTEPFEIPPVVLGEVTAALPATPAPDSAAADAWYLGPNGAAAQPVTPAAPRADESPNGLFERPSRTTHRSG